MHNHHEGGESTLLVVTEVCNGDGGHPSRLSGTNSWCLDIYGSLLIYTIRLDFYVRNILSVPVDDKSTWTATVHHILKSQRSKTLKRFRSFYLKNFYTLEGSKDTIDDRVLQFCDIVVSAHDRINTEGGGR